MAEKTHKFLKLLQKGEYARIFFRLLEYVPPAIFSYDRFYLVYCDKFVSRAIPKLSDGVTLSVVDATAAEIAKIKNIIAINTEIINFQIETAIESVKIFKIDKDGVCIGALFVKKSKGVHSPSGFSCKADRNIIYWVFGTYVHPDHRFHGYSAYLLKYAFDYCCSNGGCGLYGEIHYYNKLSILSHYRLGFRVYKNMKYIKVLNKRFFWESRDLFWCIPEDLQNHL